MFENYSGIAVLYLNNDTFYFTTVNKIFWYILIV